MRAADKATEAVTVDDTTFFAIDVSKDGSKIYQRGFENVNNRFGLNCFTCHQQAREEFDLICEQDNGCAPIPVTRPMFRALQKTDPRCKNQQPLTQEDKQALADLAEVVKTLTADQGTEKKAMTISLRAPGQRRRTLPL